MAELTLEPIESVVAPVGRRHESARPAPQERADGPRTLDGATIGFAWDYAFRGDEMFAMIADGVAVNAASARFVGPDEFGNLHGQREREMLDALPNRLREQLVDFLVVGVGA